MKAWGLYVTLLVGALLTATGALLRYIVAACDASSPVPKSILYGVTLLGQILASFAQPLFVNVPAHLSAAWFPVNERDVATTLGSMFSPIGNAVGSLLPVLLVTTQNNGSVQGMDTLTLVEFVICAVSALMSYALVRDAPPTPPSQSATEVVAALANTPSTSTNLGATLRKLSQETRELAADQNYVLLWTTFSLGVGVFNAVLTLVNQLVKPYGYSNDDAGTCGAALIVVGLLGAGLVSVLLERTRKYREIVKWGFTCCFCAIVIVTCMLRENNLGPLIFSFALLGFVLLPMLPASYEFSSEITYPIPPDLSVGLLLVGGNVIGIPLTYIIAALIEEPAWGPPPCTPSNLFLVVVVGFAASLLFWVKGEYRRQWSEKQGGGQRSRLNDPLLN
jgi:FLVCR family MFS transporter 7